jgi:hypothetical protein
MSVYTGVFSVAEKLASAKLNALVLAINNHLHDGVTGGLLTVASLIAAGLVVSADGYAVYAP